jgi:hypothetical protein
MHLPLGQPGRHLRREHGFTPTVVLNFTTHELVGFASGMEQWHPVRSTFEVVG